MISEVLTQKAIESAFTAIFSAIPAIAKKGKDLLSKNGQNIHKRIQTISKIKTLLDSQKEFDVVELYHPVKIKLGDSNNVIVNSISDFGECPRIVLEGTGGQGKSFFLKYLTIKEIPRGRWIPIFCELRRKQIGEGLSKFLIRKCQEYDLFLNESDLNKLLSNGRIALILDGYDEVRYDERAKLVDEIEEMAEKFRDVPIVISTRPYTGLQWSAYFKKAKLTPFTFEDSKILLSKLIDDELILKELLETVRKNKAVRELLTTPLLVVLLAVTYRVQREIPGSLIDFYERLFSVLFYMHDNTKLDYQRERRFKGAEFALRNIIEGIAFCATRERVSRFNKERLCLFIKNSSAAIGYASVSEDDVVWDLVNALCLLLEDGYEEYEFFHKSVQEYFAAKFVRRLSDSDVKSFYKVLVSDNKELWQWRGTLLFLKEIESDRYDEYFQLPILKRLSLPPDGGAKSIESIVFSIIGKTVGFSLSENGEITAAYFESIGGGIDLVGIPDKAPQLFHHCMKFVSDKVKNRERIGRVERSGTERATLTVRVDTNKELSSSLADVYLKSKIPEQVTRQIAETKLRIMNSKKGISALVGLGGLR